MRNYTKAQKLLSYARSSKGAKLAQLLQLQEQQQHFTDAKALMRAAVLEAFDAELMEALEVDLKRVERKEQMLQWFVYNAAE